jgi:hypothetical protein
MVRSLLVRETIGQTNLSFLQLPSVDLVVGMGWLQYYSPMKVDLYNKMDGHAL